MLMGETKVGRAPSLEMDGLQAPLASSDRSGRQSTEAPCPGLQVRTDISTPRPLWWVVCANRPVTPWSVRLCHGSALSLTLDSVLLCGQLWPMGCGGGDVVPVLAWASRCHAAPARCPERGTPWELS